MTPAEPAGETPAPPSIRRAVIDVGTNSVKLLVADVAGRTVRPLYEQSLQTRLGRGFYAAHVLQPAAIASTADAVAGFAVQARERASASIRVLATSAARDAQNADQLVAAIERAAGVRLEIVSGEQEAHWAFAGVASDPRLAGQPLLIMDSGGGSTQLIYGPEAGEPARHSFRIGAVRLLERFPPSDPPLPEELGRCRDWLRRYLREHTPKALAPGWAGDPGKTPCFVGTGGASSLLAAMHLGLAEFDRERLESVELTTGQVTARLEGLWGLAWDDRQRLPGLPRNKADVVLMGVAIHEAVMASFAVPAMRVSTRGFRFAALMEAPTS